MRANALPAGRLLSTNAAPQSSNIGYDLLEKYEQALASGDFVGD